MLLYVAIPNRQGRALQMPCGLFDSDWRLLERYSVKAAFRLSNVVRDRHVKRGTPAMTDPRSE